MSFNSQNYQFSAGEHHNKNVIYRRFYERLDKNIPKSTDSIISMLADYDFVLQGENGLNITNLGAILLANDIRQFSHLKGKTVRILRYTGTNNLVLDKEYTIFLT